MMSRNFIPEQELIDKFLMGDAEAFEELTRRYCYPLYSYCLDKLSSPDDAKRVVRSIFICLWENRQSIPLDFSLPVYLYTEVRKSVVQCLNSKLNSDSDLPTIEQVIIPGFSASRLQKAKQPVKYIASKKSVDPYSASGRSGNYEGLRWTWYSPFNRLKDLKHAFRDMLNLM